jgi:hypothetical protein
LIFGCLYRLGLDVEDDAMETTIEEVSEASPPPLEAEGASTSAMEEID